MRKQVMKRLGIVILVVIVFIGGLIYLVRPEFYTSLFNNMTDTSPIVRMLKEKYPKNDKVNQIIKNMNQYPESLVSVLQHYEESIDYVYDYPNRQQYDHIILDENDLKREIPLFIQWDKRWGYDQYGDDFMGLTGCGPTALSMVIVGLTKNDEVNPRVVANYSKQQGYYVDNVGTAWALMSEGASDFGVTGTQISGSQQSVLDALSQHHPVILSVGPGDFTPGGHFIVLTGIDEEGNILINDPNSRIKSEQSWSLDRLLGQSVGAWEFY